MSSKLTEKDVLYEDNHIIAVNKRPSDIVQGDKTGDQPLSDKVKVFLKEKYNKPGNVFAGVVHRLDRPVSGVVLFAKTGKALSRLNELIRDRQIRKRYWAIIPKQPPRKQDKLVHYLIKNQQKNMSFAFMEEGKGRLKAELEYTLIGRSDNYYLLDVNLLTGRHHQIRVQLAEIGCPVKGDLKYGAARSNKDGSIHLHAKEIEFIHPVKKEKIIISAPPPRDPVWDYFREK
ncbi:MAG: RNA pseudouridine synthase [Bacteroidota bacterium]|nr:RNA pseudouridine synthase [Bacteroidota bacterium]